VHQDEQRPARAFPFRGRPEHRVRIEIHGILVSVLGAADPAGVPFSLFSGWAALPRGGWGEFLRLTFRGLAWPDSGMDVGVVCRDDAGFSLML
jgi:hypothetical protein